MQSRPSRCLGGLFAYASVSGLPNCPVGWTLFCLSPSFFSLFGPWSDQEKDVHSVAYDPSSAWSSGHVRVAVQASTVDPHLPASSEASALGIAFLVSRCYLLLCIF